MLDERLVGGALVEDDFKADSECSGVKLCVNIESEFADIMRTIPESHLVQGNISTDTFVGFFTGKCNVVLHEATGSRERALEALGYPGEFRGSKIFNKDIMTMSTKDDDPQRSNFVNIVLKALFAAEQ